MTRVSVGWALSLAACLIAGAVRAGERDPVFRYAPPSPDLADCAPGLVAVPGTRTCLRVAGRARAEISSGGPGGAVRPGVGGRLTLDARTQTEAGPVRTFLQLGTGPR